MIPRNLDELDDRELTAQAQKVNPKCKRWVGRRGGSGRTEYVCYLCEEVIATESAKYPMTLHAFKAIAEHGVIHKS